MPRLDRWLRDSGYFTSRQRAKRAIKKGLVLVNGKEAKPSTHVTQNDEIQVSENARDMPLGYLKIKRADDVLSPPLISSGDRVLDIGSSAGGFILYARDKGANILGIEISDEFLPQLLRIDSTSEGVSILAGDAFTMPMEEIPGGEFDTILIDVTTEPESTLTLVRRFHEILRSSGKTLVAFKAKPTSENILRYQETIEELGFINCQPIILDENRQEFYIFAEKPE